MRQLISACFFLLFFNGFLFGQTPDSVATQPPDSLARPLADSLMLIQKNSSAQSGKHQFSISHFLKDDYPSPRKAILFSFILPGAGQAYNRKWWKVPIALGGVGFVGYLIQFNYVSRGEWQRNYLAEVDENPATRKDLKFAQADRTTLKQGRDYYQKNLELTYLGGAVAYLLIATDAFVDAHLKTFDVSDDLSMKISPLLESSSAGPSTFGLGFRFVPRLKRAAELEELTRQKITTP